MSKTVVKRPLYVLLCVFILLSVFATQNVSASEQNNEIQILSVYLQKTYHYISIRGITATCSAELKSNSSLRLTIKMELQKKKSGVYETIKTWSAGKTGTALSVSEKRAINLLSDYRLKTTFTAGSENKVAYAYPIKLLN